MKYILSIITFTLFISSCSNKLSEADFLNAMATDQSFVKISQLENYKIKCSFLPAAYMALQESIKEAHGSKVTATIFNAAHEKFKNAFYFNYVISSPDDKSIIAQLAHNQEEYAFVVSELTYNMHTMIYMVRDDKDTLRALGYNYDNLYSSGKTLNFLFAFPKSESGEKLDLVFDDKLFGTHSKKVMSYKFKDLIKELPKIKDIK